ncbi:hypothetical protein PoB_005044500 [Plakobranchus ocellatus]|uniref:Uncharacterized protein n=1 Tax=Plakobranchus ocellatus TaxID=259542 RepID=A0AAV4BXQ4_9GAST|nr:hypothetical protein PoB_005044500 [Plakobranchus ocellatus]
MVFCNNNIAASKPHQTGVIDRFLYIASAHQGDLRLSGPMSGQGTGDGARTRDIRVLADLRADSLATVPLMPPSKRKIIEKLWPVMI